MRKIIATVFISLDGVVDELDQWHFSYFNDEMGAAVDRVLATADTLLLGRKTYDSFAGAWPEVEAAGGEDAEFAKGLDECALQLLGIPPGELELLVGHDDLPCVAEALGELGVLASGGFHLGPRPCEAVVGLATEEQGVG
ncbi:MAG TPA: dihydrofolate reductase family protein, partial [Actinomycetota bacterium]|nr:dihydrofolate reductase family protein [Actinomycetota bacterium]